MNKSFDETLMQCPELSQCFHEFHRSVWQQPYVPIEVLELCRLRIAQLLSAESDSLVRYSPAAGSLSEQKVSQLAYYYRSDEFSPVEQACLQLAECFVIDPATISDAMATAVIIELGDAGYVALLEACGLFDGFSRFRLLLNCSAVGGDYALREQAIGDAAPREFDKACAGQMRVTAASSATGSMVRDSPLNLVPETLEAFIQFYQSLWQGHYMRAAELEVARLRNASLVNCTFCKATRFDVACNDGLTEQRALAALGAGGATIVGRDALIVGWTEQFLLRPAEPDRTVIDQVGAAFSEPERVALTTGLALFMCFSKFAVAVGGLPDELPVMLSPVPC